MNLTIGPLNSIDLDAADRIFRLAFGTRNGLADPMRFDGDASRIKTRFHSSNVIHLGAWAGTSLVAIDMATIWGSYAWLGPLAVLPEYWNAGIGQRLMEPAMKALELQGVKHTALFTVAESAKHIALYRKYGFWPWFLTLLMRKDVAEGQSASRFITYGGSSAIEKKRYLAGCRDLANLIYPGLDLSQEIRAVDERSLGDTVVECDEDGVSAFAICHCGPGTEAESGTAYIKFAAARPGPCAANNFERLVTDCESLAAMRGLTRLIAGINTGRRDAYARMASNGFRAVQQGVAMHRPDEPGYDRPDVYAIDDLR